MKDSSWRVCESAELLHFEIDMARYAATYRTGRGVYGNEMSSPLWFVIVWENVSFFVF